MYYYSDSSKRTEHQDQDQDLKHSVFSAVAEEEQATSSEKQNYARKKKSRGEVDHGRAVEGVFLVRGGDAGGLKARRVWMWMWRMNLIERVSGTWKVKGGKRRELWTVSFSHANQTRTKKEHQKKKSEISPPPTTSAPTA